MKSLLERPDDQAGHEGHSHEHGGIFGMNTELIFALICGALLGAGALAGKLGLIDRLPLILYVSAYVFGGWFTTKEAVTNIRQKRFEIDSLMLLAAVGAASIGAWAEGALLLFLFSLGHSLESYAMGRAKKAIEALSKLAPATAIVRRANGTVEMPVELLVPGDVVIVRPNDRLPADGFVVVGSSSINQAPVTGESVPVDKQPVPDAELARSKPDAVDAASKVFAGTINGETLIEVEVTRRSTESTLGRLSYHRTALQSHCSPCREHQMECSWPVQSGHREHRQLLSQTTAHFQPHQFRSFRLQHLLHACVACGRQFRHPSPDRRNGFIHVRRCRHGGGVPGRDTRGSEAPAITDCP